MESNNKNKKNTVWIILTCVFALTTLVLGMALYRSQSDRKLLESQLAGAQDVVAVTMDQQQQLAGADNLQEIRIMNGILQQQDKHQQWVDVAPVEDLLQADPVLAGRNKMQELITQNREAVQNGTISAEQISPLMAKAGTLTGVALVSASRVESSNNKTTAQPPKAQTGSNSTTTVTAPAATPVATPAPVQQPDNNNNSDNDHSDNDSSDNGSSDNGSSDSNSGGDSSDSGDGEDIGWTDEIL
uniref:hypothetical protein n=2 Tax=Lachnospiraceae TaxID=186803 RepID=UPI004025E9E3